MELDTLITNLGTPTAATVILIYGFKKMYEHFKNETTELKETIKQKDMTIEELNKVHTSKIEELVANNIEINTLINENIKQQNESIKSIEATIKK